MAESPHHRQIAYVRRKRAESPEFRAKTNAWNNVSQKRRRATKDGWMKSQLIKIRHRCGANEIPFNLTIHDLEIPAICPVLGIPLVCGLPYSSPNAPSVDRRRPTLGYVKGNVTVISWRANHLKNDCVSGEELRRVAAYIDDCTGD